MSSSGHINLAIAGAFGSLVRLILFPEKSALRWLSQVVVGIICAVYLGGGLAEILGFDNKGMLMLAFLTGTTAEKALAKVQSKFLGDNK